MAVGDQRRRRIFNPADGVMAMRVAIFNDTSVTNHFGCTAVMSAIIEACAQNNVEIAYRWPVGEDWQPFKAILDQYKVDAFIVNGEGSIHHSIDRPRARSLCALGPYAESKGIPAYLINASVEALENAELENLKTFTAISVRESLSQQYLAHHGIASEVAGDLSFSTAISDNGKRSGILVTDSVLRPVSTVLEKIARRSNAKYMSMRTRHTVLQRLMKKLSADEERPITSELDPKLRERLTQFTNMLSKSEFLLTGRFHSVCLGLLTHTPMIAVNSNTHKISGILNDALGNTHRVVDTQSLDDFDLKAQMQPWTDVERSASMDYLKKMQVTQAEFFTRIFA
ncbi:polysaccharide pyruvyl transferase family protein [Yoonia sp. BS5-3]|uniref:Polysaccharide pyruvyl transferase family protein n=1 Tax=Yoonia phaeophyticola TaxID=3137369 RepID=A0ABZ2UZW0_9RHOB